MLTSSHAAAPPLYPATKFRLVRGRASISVAPRHGRCRRGARKPVTDRTVFGRSISVSAGW
jgi:hypothetical protein